VDLLLARTLFQLGLVHERVVVEAAVNALETGQDSPSLRLLAGLIPAESDRTGELLTKAAEEIGLPARDELASVLVAGRWMAAEALAGRRDIEGAFRWIVLQTWSVYEESPTFEEDPARRPAEVQRLIAQLELEYLLTESEHVPSVFPPWFRERLLADVEAVLKALAEASEWLEPTAWEGVTWNGKEFKHRSLES
jgi:hypothetical protein